MGAGCWVLGVGCWGLGDGCWGLGVGDWLVSLDVCGRINAVFELELGSSAGLGRNVGSNALIDWLHERRLAV